MAHYFPGLKIDELNDEEFAMWSENAQYMHSQLLLQNASNMASMLGGGGSGK